MTALYRCNMVDGRALVVQGNPPCATYNDAVLFPGIWGLYEASRKLITSSGYFRGPVPSPLGNAEYVREWDDFTVENAPDENYYYIGAIHNHYGHFILSTLSRLWAYPPTGMPRPKLVISGGVDILLDPTSYMGVLFGALGIAASDFVYFDRPVRFRTITVPGPAFEETNFAYTAFAKLCQHIASVVLAPFKPCCSDNPVYLSKTMVRRGVMRFSDEQVIEDKLAAAGVEIVHPEELSLVDQIRLMNERSVICGAAGSAMHTAAFAKPTRLLILNYGSAMFSNQVIINRVCGHQAVQLYPSAGLTVEDDAFGASRRLRDPDGVADAYLRILRDIQLPLGAAFVPERRGGTRPVVNLAHRRPARQSSQGQWSVEPTADRDASCAVSGFLTGSHQCHTHNQTDPWWAIDLGFTATIKQVVIYNRTDSGESRADRLRIELSDDGKIWQTAYCREDEPTFGGIIGSPFAWVPITEVTARYVRIVVLGADTYLHFDQIVILGY